MSLPLADKWIWVHSGRRAHRTDTIMTLEVIRSERKATKDLWYARWSMLSLLEYDIAFAGYQGKFTVKDDVVYFATYQEAIEGIELYHIAALKQDLRRFEGE